MIIKNKFETFNSDNIKFADKHAKNAQQTGINTVFVKSNFILLTFIKRLVFKKPVKKFEKYIIPIKP